MTRNLPGAKYRLGQNFLTDPKLLDCLVALNEAMGEDVTCLEIGCGRGDLTAALLRTGASVIGVEVDPDLTEVLEQRFRHEIQMSQLRLIEGDALALDWSEFEVTELYSNVPYYLTRHLLRKAFVELPELRAVYYTLQLEAAQRLLADDPLGANYVAKLYGPLAILRAFYGTGAIVHRFSRYDFDPPPRVDSVFVELRAHAVPYIFYLEHSEFCAQMLERAFKQRRKKLLNNWRDLEGMDREELRAFLVKTGHAEARAEELTFEEWIILLEALAKEFSGLL